MDDIRVQKASSLYFRPSIEFEMEEEQLNLECNRKHWAPNESHGILGRDSKINGDPNKIQCH